MLKAAQPTIHTAMIRPASMLPDSLGWSLVLAARVIASVRARRSLSEAFIIIANEPPVARSAAQDAAYGVLRRYARGEFFLGRLMSKPLTHPETYALLLAAIYRLETRADSWPMIVDQAVSAAGELAGGVFKGLVNGVLRNFLRQRESLQEALINDEEAQYQYPRWWVNRLRRAYQDDWESIISVGNCAPPMTLRVNRRRETVTGYTAKLEEAGISARSVGVHGLILQKPVSVDALP